MDINHSVYISAFECHLRQGPWVVENHHHNIYELYGCVQGTVVQSINGKDVRMMAGDWILFQPGCRHSLSKPAEPLHQYFVFHFHLDDLALPKQEPYQEYLLVRPTQKQGEIGRDGDAIRSNSGNPEIDMAYAGSLPWLQKQIVRLVNQNGLMNIGEKGPVPDLPVTVRLQLEALFLLAIAEVYAHFGASVKGDAPLPTRMCYRSTAYRSMLANEIARLVEWQLPGKLDMAGIAKILGISISACTRCFRQHFGQSPSSYRKTIILSQARDLLLQTDLTVTSIADSLGFSSLELFSRQFRRWTGLSPSAFRSSR